MQFPGSAGEHGWSSTAAHVEAEDGAVAKAPPVRGRFGDWREFLWEQPSEEALAALRQHERTGRPLGSMSLIADLERQLGRVLAPQRPGRKRKQK